MGLFFQVVTEPRRGGGDPRLVVVPLIFADVCLMHARDPGRGNHWGDPRWKGGFDEVFLRDSRPQIVHLWGEGLSNKGLLKSRLV